MFSFSEMQTYLSVVQDPQIYFLSIFLIFLNKLGILFFFPRSLGYRLKVIDRCFSQRTVEEIISALVSSMILNFIHDENINLLSSLSDVFEKFASALSNILLFSVFTCLPLTWPWSCAGNFRRERPWIRRMIGSRKQSSHWREHHQQALKFVWDR